MEFINLAFALGVSFYAFSTANKMKKDNAYLLPSEKFSLWLNEARMDAELFKWYKEKITSPEKRLKVRKSLEAIGGISAIALILIIAGIIMKLSS